MNGEIAHAQRSLLSLIARRGRLHRHGHLTAEHALVDVGRTKQRAGVIGAQQHDLASIRLRVQFTVERAVVADLRGQPQTANFAAPPRHFQRDVAQRLAVEAEHGAELHVEVNIGCPPPGLCLSDNSAGQRPDEVAPVVDLAAHDDVQRSVWPTFDFERRIVSIGETVGLEIGRLQLARAVELDRTLDAVTGALDRQIVDADRLRLGRQSQRGALPAGRLP